jgi:predicted translation initiation factor SUI1
MSQQHKTVLFLCTGNYYRSRYAEILFNSIAKRMGLKWTAISKGLAMERGVNNVGPMAAVALQALEARRILDAEQCTRFPMQVMADDLDKADLIIALNHAEHLPLQQERFPAFVERVEFWHVDDAPEALAIIESEIMDLVARLLGGVKKSEASLPDVSTEAKSQVVKETPTQPITAKVGRETAGRRGKGVTTVFDVPLDEEALRELAAKLKQRCGTGGTVKDGRIEIQGDQRERIVKELEGMGFKVKRAGG